MSGFVPFTRKREAEYPFAIPVPNKESGDYTSPSGSHWKLEHLQWLGVELRKDCSQHVVINGRHQLSANSVIVRYLEDNLSRSWEDVMKGPQRPGEPSFYRKLRELASHPDFWTSYTKPSPIAPDKFSAEMRDRAAKRSISENNVGSGFNIRSSLSGENNSISTCWQHSADDRRI